MARLREAIAAVETDSASAQAGHGSGRTRTTGHGPSPDGPDADPLEVTREMTLRRLEQRDYSRGELSDYLVRRRGADPEVAEAVLVRLEAVGLIDDARFAASWVDSRRRTKQLSRRALVQELRAKKVSDELIDAALEEVDGEQERELALSACRARANRLHGVDRQVAFRRLAGALARKGFPASTVVSVVTQVLDESVDSPNGDDS